MNILSIIITVLLVLDAIGMIIIVLMQKTKTAGLGAAFGDDGASFTSKGRAASKEAKLQKITIILAIVFGVLALVLAVIG
ncbi:MAG: preprotein translocase subunit SecG [Clostridia bacterium]|nr:preprotein translocase subunit SecG [Clostridia bacterium]MBQ3663933.1 preprotein translocase subunit SecG [Clostridia bacterium]MCR5072956.1 preprotein translocase subunit SecG [Clostridiales bacterium]